MYNKKIIDGYFEKTMRYDDRLQYCPNGSCGVMYFDSTDGGYIATHAKNSRYVALVSYSSIIFVYDKVDKVFDFDFSQAAPNYSRTTIRHVSAFCDEYCYECYQDVKDLYYYQSTKNVT